MAKEKSEFMKGIDVAAAVILAFGGLNWGLIGFFEFNLVDAIFGAMSVFSRMIYCLVGIAALYEVIMYRTIQRRWECTLWPRVAERSVV